MSEKARFWSKTILLSILTVVCLWYIIVIAIFNILMLTPETRQITYYCIALLITIAFFGCIIFYINRINLWRKRHLLKS
ncbi:MAG: hypothetical protein C0154_04525 [Mucilaginibacter sp.]|nr:MAG: hypothetical protein BGO48_14020 [Mucilaginibacter sp. 44-25]PLW90828.1 MAG: hypothetical protein C0154_04525 [Mucilaginibacter sp.]PMP66060.1 MAG: hypothetical protein C0191_01850 [Mucilaginibacter sp.]